MNWKERIKNEVDWYDDKISNFVNEVRKRVDEPFPQEKHKLEEIIDYSIMAKEKVGQFLAVAEAELNSCSIRLMKHPQMPAKERGNSDEREAQLKNLEAPYRLVRDSMKYLLESINKKIDCGNMRLAKKNSMED